MSEPSAAKLREAADAAAMERIARGDEAAIGELYDRYAPLAMGIALKIAREQNEAEDIVHDAFVAVVERADQYRADRGTVAAWLVTTVGANRRSLSGTASLLASTSVRSASSSHRR